MEANPPIRYGRRKERRALRAEAPRRRAGTPVAALAALVCAVGCAPGSGSSPPAAPAASPASSSAAGGLLGSYLERQAREFDAIPGARVERQDDRLLVTFAGDELFDSGSASLSPGVTRRFEIVAEILKRYPETEVVVRGYTDSVGSETQNLRLSEERAGHVRDDLVAMGVAPRRITAIGFGEQFPAMANETEAGRQRNRRVELELVPRQDQLTEGTGRY